MSNNNTYVGSGLDLSKRVGDYYKKSELSRNLRPIHAALLKYGYENFNLEILEYCDISLLISKEQNYIDSLKPEYNIRPTANSPLGHKHSPETKAKMSKIALNRTKLSRPGNEVEVFDIKTNQTTTYSSIREAVKGLNTYISTLLRREERGTTTPFRGRYVITIKRS